MTLFKRHLPINKQRNASMTILSCFDQTCCWWRVWMVLVGPWGKSSALVEVCCMTLTQHTSTNYGPVYSYGFGHWLTLRERWRSTSLLYVWLLELWSGCRGYIQHHNTNLHTFINMHHTNTTCTSMLHTPHPSLPVSCPVSLSVLSFCAPLSMISVSDKIRVLGVNKAC